jgi:hypothetical protein
MTKPTRYRLLEPMLVIENERGGVEVRVPKLVSATELSRIADGVPSWYGAPTYYAIWPEPDPACYLPLMEPKKKET